MNINWREFINVEYWLAGIAGPSSNNQVTPPVSYDSSFYWVFPALFAVVTILAILMRTSQSFMNSEHPLQKMLPLWSSNIMAIGFLGLSWFALRQLSVSFLGARLWLLVFAIWFLILLYFIIRYFVLFFPLEIQFFRSKFSQAKK